MTTARAMGLLAAWVVCVAASVASGGTDMAATRPDRAALPRSPLQVRASRLPLAFEVNRGQTDAQVQFLARGTGYRLFLTATEAVLDLRRPRAARCGREDAPGAWGRSPAAPCPPEMGEAAPPADPDVLRLRLVGAHPQPPVHGREPLPGKVHDFRGNDPSRWRTQIPTYARVEYQEVYPGVSLVYYGTPRQLEYDFRVAPGADPTAITLAFEGLGPFELDAQGDLVWQTAGGELRLHPPRLYQEGEGGRQAIAGSYVRRGPQQVGVVVGGYDAARALVIDPVLEYSTYLGGSGGDSAWGIAVDGLGQVYLTGQTASPDFPTANPVQPGYGGGPLYGDVFVAKLNPEGSALLYATYLGGLNDDFGKGIAVDTSGHAYVTGVTNSPDFPIALALQPRYEGGADAFIAKLSPDGSTLMYATYLGGSGTDIGNGIAVDPSGSAYVTGDTTSADFPTLTPLQPTKRGPTDAFVAKLNPQGTGLVYATYLGGSDTETPRGIAVDATGHAYVTGSTSSRDFPTLHPVQAVFGGYYDVFVAKLTPEGSALMYATYLGGRDIDFSCSIAVDAEGYASVTGYTQSFDFPTVHPLQATFGGGSSIGADAFVARLTPEGSALVYATYLGGHDDDFGSGIAVDAAGYAYVTGLTKSRDFPLANPLQPTHGGGLRDAFVAKLRPDGSALVYSTYLGGRYEDYGNAIAVDGAGDAYVAGGTTSDDFPTAHPLQPELGGQPYVYADAFVAKLRHAPAPEIVVEPLSVMFGAVRVGQSRTAQVILRNGGEAELMVSAINGVVPPFALLGPLPPLSLDPGETIAVEVRFTPTQPGKAQQALRIHSTDPDEPEVAVTLQGRGWGRRGP